MAAIMSGSGESSTLNLISKKRAKLIAFDKEKKIQYFGPCSNVLINAADRCLILTTNSTVKNLKEVASTFNRIFIQKENALCVIDDGITNKNFMIIFPSKERCDQSFEAINRAKYPNITPPPKNDPFIDDNLFKTNFYVPILKEIKAQIPGFEEIKITILDLVNLFEDDKRKSYLNMVFEILVFSDVSTSDDNENGVVQDSSVSSNNGIVDVRKSTVPSKVEIMIDEDDKLNGDVTEQLTICTENDETLNGSLNSTNQSLNETTKSGYGLRKRARPNYDERKSFESNEITMNLSTSAAKKSRVLIPNVLNESTNEIQSNTKTRNLSNVISANYEFVDCFSRGAVRNRLLIFTTNEKNECYEFYYCTTKEWHHCKSCSSKKISTCIKIISAKNGKIDFCFGKQNHICKPVKYSPEKYVINEEMNLMKIDNTENWEKGRRKSGAGKVIKSTDFQIVNQIFGGRITQKLIIFDENDRSLCYQYGISNKLHQRYRCNECLLKHKQYVYATFIKSEDNGNNGNIVKLGVNEHLCKPKKFPFNTTT